MRRETVEDSSTPQRRPVLECAMISILIVTDLTSIWKAVRIVLSGQVHSVYEVTDGSDVV